MTVHDLYMVSPQAFIFIVTRGGDFKVTSRKEYLGGDRDGGLVVGRVLPTSYPMYRHVLEVEIKTEKGV